MPTFEIELYETRVRNVHVAATSAAEAVQRVWTGSYTDLGEADNGHPVQNLSVGLPKKSAPELHAALNCALAGTLPEWGIPGIRVIRELPEDAPRVAAMAVACYGVHGVSCFYFLRLRMRLRDITEDQHYEQARQLAEEAGYGEPFVVYAENDGPLFLFESCAWSEVPIVDTQ